MGKSSIANINPNILSWCISESGYSIDDIGSKISKSPEIINKWVIGIEKPSISQLFDICKVLKRPVDIFFCDEIPKTKNEIKDYRRNTKIPLDPKILINIRKNKEKVEIYSKLSNLKYNEDNFSYFSTDNIEYSANKIREIFNIPFSFQLKWNKKNVLNNWRKILEGFGILTFQIDKINPEIFDGAAIRGNFNPFIVINIASNNNRKIFTLFHELAHIFVQNNIIENDIYDYENLSFEIKNEELICNEFAGNFLVPRREITDQIRGLSNKINDINITYLAEYFSVSKQVILFRLKNLGYISEDDFWRRFRSMQDINNIKQDDAESNKKYKYSWKRRVSENSFKFIDTMLDSYNENKIGTLDLLHYFDIKLEHLVKYEAAYAKNYVNTRGY